MEAALLLAALAARAGDRVDFVAGDRRVRARLRLAGARDATRRLQDALADLEPEIAEADWTALAGAVQTLGRQRALVVLLSPLEPSAVEEGLLPSLPVLARHHRVVLASVRDPELARLAAARDGLDEVYAAAAAEQALARRRATAAVLETLGVDVLDVGRRPSHPPSPTTTSPSRPAACSESGLPASGLRRSLRSRSRLAGDAVVEQGGVEVAGLAAQHGRAGRGRRRRPGRWPRRGRRSRSGPRSAGRLGVTKASRQPLTASTPTRPSATVPAVRPSRANDCERVRSPGSTHDQNSRSPTPAATKTAVSSRARAAGSGPRTPPRARAGS